MFPCQRRRLFSSQLIGGLTLAMTSLVPRKHEGNLMLANELVKEEAPTSSFEKFVWPSKKDDLLAAGRAYCVCVGPHDFHGGNETFLVRRTNYTFA